MNRFKKAAMSAFSRNGANSEEQKEEAAAGEVPGGSGADGSATDSNPKEPVYNEHSAEPVNTEYLKGRRGSGLLSAISDRKLLGGSSKGYADDLNGHDEDISVMNYDEGNEAGEDEAEELAKRNGELNSKPSKESETQGRARRSQQPPKRRQFHKTKAREEATATKTDNEDLKATVAQVDEGEGGYSQLVLSEKEAPSPEQRPESAQPEDSSNAEDDSATETDNEDKPSPKEGERQIRSDRTSKGNRPKESHGSSRKPQSGGTHKERPRKPGEKRSSNDGSRRPTEHRRSSNEGEHRRHKPNDSVDSIALDSVVPLTPTGGKKAPAPVDDVGALGMLNLASKEEESLMPTENDAQKVKDSEKEMSKSKRRPKERELMEHFGKPAKRPERGVRRSNSSKSMFVNSKKDKAEVASGDNNPTMSVRPKRGDTGLLLGRLRTAVSDRNLIVSSDHDASVMGPGSSDTVSQSDHGTATSLDLGPAATDSATLAALTTLSWTTRPASPQKTTDSTNDVAVVKPNLFTSLKDDDSASGKLENTGPDAPVVVSDISPDPDESTKNKASKDTKDSTKRIDSVGSKPRRDGRESSGPTSSSKRNESSSSKPKRDGESRTRSRPESRQRGHSVNPEARSRGTSVRAQERRKKSEPDAPSERRRRRPSMAGAAADVDGHGDSRSKLHSERGSEPPTGQHGSVSETATAQIDNRSNHLSAGDVPATPGPEDAGRRDTASKAAVGEVAEEPKDPGSPTNLSAPLSPSKQNGTSPKKRHGSIPRSPRSPRRALGSPRRRPKAGSSPTDSTPKISLQLAMALAGPPNLDEGDESSTLEADTSTDVGVAKIGAKKDVKSRAEYQENIQMPEIILSEDGDDPLFEDWSDAADDEGLLESCGSSPRHPQNAAQEQRVQETVGHTSEDWSDAADDEDLLESFGKAANLDRGSEHASQWSDAADESVATNLQESPLRSTAFDPKKRAQGFIGDEVSEKPATLHAAIVPETIIIVPETIVPEPTIHSDHEESKQNSETTFPKAAETLETGVGTREPIATEVVDNKIDVSTGAPLDGVATKKDEERIEAMPKRLETDESADAAFLDDHAKQMQGVSLEVENEVPLLFMSDMVSENSKSKSWETLDKDNFSNDIAGGSALTHVESQQQSTNSVDENQAAETTEAVENTYASSSVFALLSSELAGSKQRLAETRLEVSQLEKEVDLLRLRLNALEKTLS